MKDITENEFNDMMAAKETVVLDFHAQWCGPCKLLAPKLQAAEARHPDVTFAKVDIDAEQRMAERMHVMAVPTLVVLRDGLELGRQVGAISEAALQDFLLCLSQ